MYRCTVPDQDIPTDMLELACLLLMLTDPARETSAPEPSVKEQSKIAMKSPNAMECATRMAPITNRKHDEWPLQSLTLTSDWNGLRTDLEESGIYLQGRYTALLMENFSGGLDTGFFGGGPIGLTLTADTEKLLSHDGGTFFIDLEYFDWYNDRFPQQNAFDPTGSWVGSNGNFIDDDESTFAAIAQLYYEQSFFDDACSLRFGKMDANSTFSNIDAAGSFQYNLMHNPPSLNLYLPTYPEEATALQARVHVGDHVTGHFGWYDGTSAALDPATGSVGPGTGTRGPATFFDNDGHWFLITEWEVDWQLSDRHPGSFAFGAWLQTGRTTTAGSSSDGVEDVPGLYMSWQQTIWSGDKHSANTGGGIRFFGQFSLSDADKNPSHWSLMAGLSATGIIPGRPADALGLAGGWTAFSGNQAIYQSVLPNGDPGPAGGHETGLELFYKAQITPWLYVQPGFEWIGSPGGGESSPLDDDIIGYVLVGMEF